MPSSFEVLFEMISAGTPAIDTLSGKSFVTTLFAPIETLFPILISPKILAPGPMYTLSPIVGAPW